MFHRRALLLGIFCVIAAVGAGQAAGGERKPDVHFVPTPPEVVEEMLKVTAVGSGDIVYDLGCGDGRIVITAVEKFGAKKGTGIDIDPQRIKECHENARKANVGDRVTFLEQDIYDSDFSEATVLTLYLLPRLNVRLRPIIFRQLRPGDRIASHAFDMAEWQADKTIEVPCSDQQERTVYYWVVPAGVAGTWQFTLPGEKGDQACQLRLRQRFQSVSGTLKLGDQDLPITDATLVGDRLAFAVARPGKGEKSGRMSFSGRVVGDSIGGTVEMQGGAGKREWTAKRDPFNLVGTWNWSLADGKPAALRIRRQDGRTYGSLTVEGKPLAIPQFYAWGAEVYFIRETGGNETYEGVVEGDRIVGTVTAEGSAAKEWVAQRAAK